MIVRITSKFGAVDAVHKTPHSGIDLSMSEGTPLEAIKEGVIDRIYDGTGAIGKGLSIKFEDGTRAIYGHMSEVGVRVGERVGAGEIIGLSGNTGRSTGPHLHLGLKDSGGTWMDPTHLAERFIQNGRIGDGIGDLNVITFKEWLGGKLAEITLDGFVGSAADMALAFPFLTVVSGGVYALLNMVSKRLGVLGAIGTLLYGMFVIK